MTRRSSTNRSQESYYPSVSNKKLLNKATKNEDGTKKDGISKNQIINKALKKFFAENPQYVS